MKICTKCDHFKRGMYNEYCKREIRATDLVTGEISYFSAATSRAMETMCGQEGKWFKPRVFSLIRVFTDFFISDKIEEAR